MALELDLRKYVKTYGKHQLKIIATGEGFRNSEPTITEFESRPYIEYSEDGIRITNIQKGVTEIELYVDENLAKTVIHDPDDTDDVLVDFTETIVDDIGIYHFYVIVRTNYGDFISNTTMSTKIFGVSGMYDSALALTRTDDSEGMSFAIDTTTGLVTSDFDDVFPYNEIHEVEIDGNKFVSIPSMWWRIGKDEEDNLTDIAVARCKKGQGKWFRSDAFLVGKYMSYYENNKMVSKAGKAMTQNYSSISWTSYAKANGDGYKPIGVYEHTILTFLWLIEFANKRSVAVINGYSSYNYTTGGTDSIATETGYMKSTNQMKYRGIEDFVGNDCEWMPDVTGNYYTSRDINTYTNGTVGKSQLCYWKNISSLGASWRGVMALGWDDEHPFICLPSKLGTNNTTYFGTCMYGPNNSADIVTKGKAYSGYTTNAGLSSVIYDYNFTNAVDHATSRLVKY